MTRILLADDHQILRHGLRVLLEKERGIEVVGEAEDGRRAVELARTLKPGIVIMDLQAVLARAVTRSSPVVDRSQKFG